MTNYAFEASLSITILTALIYKSSTYFIFFKNDFGFTNFVTIVFVRPKLNGKVFKFLKN